ncbi:hypothetical protein KUCAC02_000307, partial [Chaenocephalus aceratus]
SLLHRAPNKEALHTRLRPRGSGLVVRGTRAHSRCPPSPLLEEKGFSANAHNGMQPKPLALYLACSQKKLPEARGKGGGGGSGSDWQMTMNRCNRLKLLYLLPSPLLSGQLRLWEERT